MEYRDRLSLYTSVVLDRTFKIDIIHVSIKLDKITSDIKYINLQTPAFNICIRTNNYV